MTNLELFVKDPTQSELLNNGVAEVRDMLSESELRTLRYELETYVCEGQYSAGLERILRTYLTNLDKPEQPAVWIGGFFGSGKSHLVKMLRYLWVNYEFSDKATAQGIAKLPTEITDALRELSAAGKRFGGLHAASGTISAGASSVRLALLGIIFGSAGLPENYPLAKFVLWLKRQGTYEHVKQHIEHSGKSFENELGDLYVSPRIARALLDSDPSFAPSVAEVKPLLKNQFPDVTNSDISLADMEKAIRETLTQDGRFPCTLIVLDEVQQFIGDNPDRTLKVREVVEVCSKKFDGRVVIVGTGLSALSGTPQLQKLQGRFRISLHLSDTDVETVIRKVVLLKKPDKVPVVRKVLSDYSGEISRQLVGTKIEPGNEDTEHDVEDYPLLPVRNRFWEHVLHAVDSGGMSGQLRNQLRIVHEAVKQNARDQVGTVIPGDFIYDQISTDLQQTNVLLPEIHSTIQKQRNGTAEGTLRSRLCALVFLIGKLPRENGADIGLRATSDALADLLVEDLKAGGAKLRTKVPEHLRELTESGVLIQVDNEYRLQTRESSAWDADYRDRFNKIINDEGRYASERADVLRVACGERIKTLKLSHGASSVGRKLDLHFSQQAPDLKSAAIPVWVRDGWSEDENAMLTDARRAGTESPVVYVFTPRRDNDELKRAIAGKHAADETLQVRGIPATPAAQEARQSIESRQAAANRSLQSVLENIFSGARVLLAGGSEYPGATLNDAVLSAAKDALTRLYPQFDIADHAKWETVAKRARSGDGGALEVVDYNGDPESHPVCAAVLRETNVGKRGSELRRHFASPPFGWAQDAVDGALLTLLVAGKIKATQDGRPVEPKQLDGTRIGTAVFRSEQTTLTGGQRIAIRKLFQEASVECKPNEELIAASQYLQMMLSLAEGAGGAPPLPEKPDTAHLRTYSEQSGNEQLLSLYNDRERLSREAKDWRAAKETIRQREPRWETLNRLVNHARGLPVVAEVEPQVKAISDQRSLLDGQDHTQVLCERLTQTLRETLGTAAASYEAEHAGQMKHLAASSAWQSLTPEQQSGILSSHEIASVPTVRVGSEAEVLASLASISLQDWQTRHDALSTRFERARKDAEKLAEPTAVRVRLPSATLRTAAEVDEWLAGVRDEIITKIEEGNPVIV